MDGVEDGGVMKGTLVEEVSEGREEDERGGEGDKMEVIVDETVCSMTEESKEEMTVQEENPEREEKIQDGEEISADNEAEGKSSLPVEDASAEPHPPATTSDELPQPEGHEKEIESKKDTATFSSLFEDVNDKDVPVSGGTEDCSQVTDAVRRSPQSGNEDSRSGNDDSRSRSEKSPSSGSSDTTESGSDEDGVVCSTLPRLPPITSLISTFNNVPPFTYSVTLTPSTTLPIMTIPHLPTYCHTHNSDSTHYCKPTQI